MALITPFTFLWLELTHMALAQLQRWQGNVKGLAGTFYIRITQLNIGVEFQICKCFKGKEMETQILSL